MSKEFLYIVAGFLLIAVVLLCSYIAVDECSRMHFDDNMKLWGTRDAVPDEETAKKIADIVIRAQTEILGYGLREDWEYEITATYDTLGNRWHIHYSPGIVVGGEIMIGIRKDSGMITGLAFIP